MNSSLQIPLDLPNVRLLSSATDARGNFILEVESSLTFTKCRCCGRKITEFHGYDRPIRLRHLPILGRDVWIEIRPKSYRCRHCEGDPTTTQTQEWYDPRSPHTRAFEDWLLNMLGNSTVLDVSRRCGVSYDEVEGVLKRRVSTEVDWSGFQQLRTLGIDEIALKNWKSRVNASGLACFDKFLNLLDTWQDGITNYFEDRAIPPALSKA